MEIIYVIIGFVCVVLAIIMGIVVGLGASISEYYKAITPIAKKFDKVMDPMCDFYVKMLNEYKNEE